jgi:predicted nuclease of predicted toxin-antitoxin system
MRILLDESLPRRLKGRFPDYFEVRTVQEQGWSGKSNGELLSLAENDFEELVTMDRGLEYQQNLAGFKLAVVLLRARSNRLSDLLELLPELVTTLGAAEAGQLRYVPEN